MIRRIPLLVIFLAVACGGDKAVVTSDATCGLSAPSIGQFVSVPGGSFIKGANPVYNEEAPTLALHVAPFALQAHEVTNDQFAAFVSATSYVTDAETSVAIGGPQAGSAVFDLPEGSGARIDPWRLVPGATWKTPMGPGSAITGKGLWPVVHVSERDAAAYASWAGGRLPTEVEWEYAATRGLADPMDSQSGAYDGEGRPVANTWQGIFPIANTEADGFAGAAPVGCFPPDKTGLYDMIGNVWEWTDTPYAAGSHTLKGGSYLCAENFCRRYRPAARQPQDTDFSSIHIGFRIAKDIPPSSE
jgi:sulfatase modifying factor 1